MKNLLLIIIFSFAITTGLFTHNGFAFLENFQKNTRLIQELTKISLPSGSVTENDIPEIKSKIQLAMDIISMHQIDEYKKTYESRTVKPELTAKAELKSDEQPLMSGLSILRNWLKQQKCIKDASLPLAQASGKYAVRILTSGPGQVPVKIIFNSRAGKTKEYTMLISVNTPAFLYHSGFYKKYNS